MWWGVRVLGLVVLAMLVMVVVASILAGLAVRRNEAPDPCAGQTPCARTATPHTGASPAGIATEDR